MSTSTWVVCMDNTEGNFEQIHVEALDEAGAMNNSWLMIVGAPHNYNWWPVWAKPLVEKHIHVYRDSRDCDGRFESERTVTLPTYEDRYAGATYAERERLGFFVGAELGRLLAFGIEFTVTQDENEITVSRPSDEGGERHTFSVCDDDLCEMHAEKQTIQRDHAAEAAGY